MRESARRGQLRAETPNGVIARSLVADRGAFGKRRHRTGAIAGRDSLLNASEKCLSFAAHAASVFAPGCKISFCESAGGYRWGTFAVLACPLMSWGASTNKPPEWGQTFP